MTVNEALKEAETTLLDAGITSPRADAHILLAHVLADTLSHLPTRLREPLDELTETQLGRLVARRVAREPLAYITGETEFMGLRFKCDARALVPRPETETLVETVLDCLPSVGGAPSPDFPPSPLIADIGTGAGCIAVSLAHFLPDARVFATDASADALDLARENAALNDVADRMSFLHGADLQPLFEAGIADEVSVLVSNPPYIPTSVLPTLEPEVSKREPRVALDGGPDGLDFYRRVLPRLPKLPSLRLVALEFGVSQGDDVAELVERHLRGWRTELRRDLSGAPRVVVALSPDGRAAP